jgi:hypothetical protein
MKLPPYPGTSQCVKIGSAGSARSDPSQIRLNYNLAEKDGGLLEEHVDPDPMKQFGKWFQVGLCPHGAPTCAAPRKNRVSPVAWRKS